MRLAEIHRAPRVGDPERGEIGVAGVFGIREGSHVEGTPWVSRVLVGRTG